MPAAQAVSVVDAVAAEARRGLTASPKTLPPWLFYDEAGSALFERITELPEYYLTRTERAILAAHAEDILDLLPGTLTIAELGAGTATKTGILLHAATRRQAHLLYQPIDVSPTALEEARSTLERTIPGLAVHPQVTNYITAPIRLERRANSRILALYIGSSIGNFAPHEAQAILTNLRAHLLPGDALLLGTDLPPGPTKSVATLVAAYDDPGGTTAAFNQNVLIRLNRDLHADFRPECFRHRASWNPAESRIEMHLEALSDQAVHIPANTAGPALTLRLVAGETIHTEDSYKFTAPALYGLLETAAFSLIRTFHDPRSLFAVTLASVI